jgi:hypothetical protein
LLPLVVRDKEVGANGRYALAGRDTVFSLCDGTEHGIGTFDDGEVVARDVMPSGNLRIVCFNNGASVVLHSRFELINRDLMSSTRPARMAHP